MPESLWEPNSVMLHARPPSMDNPFSTQTQELHTTLHKRKPTVILQLPPDWPYFPINLQKPLAKNWYFACAPSRTLFEPPIRETTYSAERRVPSALLERHGVGGMHIIPYHAWSRVWTTSDAYQGIDRGREHTAPSSLCLECMHTGILPPPARTTTGAYHHRVSGPRPPSCCVGIPLAPRAGLLERKLLPHRR